MAKLFSILPIMGRMIPNLGKVLPKMGREALALGKSTKQRRTTARPTGLADALFTATQQKVLGLLFGSPQRSFYASEIISTAVIGSGSVQRELARLEQSGLVTSRLVGNQKHYQANPAAPIFDELTRIAAKTFALADPIRTALGKLEPKIDLALVYGSVAKGAATASSDVDVLIVGERITLEEVFKVLDPVEAKLQRKISPTIFTKAEFARRARAKEGFLARVLEGNYIPLIGDMDAALSTG
jgi:predicted nucleotidyltransferase